MEERLKRIITSELPYDQRISRLLREIERTRRSYMDRELKRIGLQGDMYLYLLQISRLPGISQDQLAGELLVEKGNVARNAKKLCDLGYIVRETSVSDKRLYELFLTEKGTAATSEVRRVLVRWHQTVTSGMDETARHQLVESLTEILMSAESLNNNALMA